MSGPDCLPSLTSVSSCWGFLFFSTFCGALGPREPGFSVPSPDSCRLFLFFFRSPVSSDVVRPDARNAFCTFQPFRILEADLGVSSRPPADFGARL